MFNHSLGVFLSSTSSPLIVYSVYVVCVVCFYTRERSVCSVCLISFCFVVGCVFFLFVFSHFTRCACVCDVPVKFPYNMAFYIYLLDHLVGYWLAWNRFEIKLKKNLCVELLFFCFSFFFSLFL